MAETYSTQWQAGKRATPRGNFVAVHETPYYFDYTQVLVGTAADTILLREIPPHSTVSMVDSWFKFATFTATATLSIGWAAYKDEDGVIVAASAAGLLSAVVLTTDGYWSHGMLVVATPDDSPPVVPIKVFNNRDPVTLYATIGVTTVGIGATLSGKFCVWTS